MYEFYQPESAAPLGDIPGLPAIDLYEVVGGIKYVRSDIRPLAQQFIGTMTQPTGVTSTGVGTQIGTAVPMLGMPSDRNWVHDNVLTGGVVMVKPSGSGATIEFMRTIRPEAVAANAGAMMGGQYAVLEGNSEVLAKASEQSQQFPPGDIPVPSVPPVLPGPIPGPALPPVLPPVLPTPTVPVPSPGPLPPASSTPSSSKLPSWVAPVAIGAGALAVLGVVVLSRRKTKMTPNRRRRR